MGGVAASSQNKQHLMQQFQIDIDAVEQSGTSSQEISPSQIQLTIKTQNKKNMQAQVVSQSTDLAVSQPNNPFSQAIMSSGMMQPLS